MSVVPKRFFVAENEAKIASAYNQAGYRYAKYADGSGDKLFSFEGRHAFADRKTWALIDSKLIALRTKGQSRLRVLDLGCGPGTWLRRVVVRAKQMGFSEIEAQGFDIADGQLHRARVHSQSVAEMPGVNISFQNGDLRKKLPYPPNDLCLCLYGVLNHIPIDELPDALRRIAEVTTGFFVATARAIGSTPTVYVDDVSTAIRFFQDNQIGRLDVEFSDGHRTSFQSHLFSRADLARLAALSFEVEEVIGLDLFHLRFAPDPRWNPSSAAPLARLSQELLRLEERYCRDPGFIDHATHLLLVARGRGEVRK
jgi:SAM-dependent methyltransferase